MVKFCLTLLVLPEALTDAHEQFHNLVLLVPFERKLTHEQLDWQVEVVTF